MIGPSPCTRCGYRSSRTFGSCRNPNGCTSRLIERVVSLRNRSNDRAMTYAIALRSLPAREDVVGFVYHTSPNDSFGRRWYATRNEGGAERDVPGWWITRSDAIVALLDAIGFNWREVSIEGVRAM